MATAGETIRQYVEDAAENGYMTALIDSQDEIVTDNVRRDIDEIDEHDTMTVNANGIIISGKLTDGYYLKRHSGHITESLYGPAYSVNKFNKFLKKFC